MRFKEVLTPNLSRFKEKIPIREYLNSRGISYYATYFS